VNVPTLVEQDPVLAEVGRRYEGARTADEKAIAAAVGAIKERREVVSVKRVVAHQAYYFPKLAVAPPWARTLKVRVYRSGRRNRMVRLSCRRGWRRWSLRVPRAVMSVPDRRTARTMVPPVPPAYRDEIGRGTLVTWEVDHWDVRPSRDPALLHPIDRKSSDDFYLVGATWELTDLERAALGG
jgi:hypothetical protein